jgi:hypothetical protein
MARAAWVSCKGGRAKVGRGPQISCRGSSGSGGKQTHLLNRLERRTATRLPEYATALLVRQSGLLQNRG